jgi:hypothetical protein
VLVQARLNVLVLDLVDHNARVAGVRHRRGERRRRRTRAGSSRGRGRRRSSAGRRSSRAGSSGGAGRRAQGRGVVDLVDDPRRGVVGVQLKVVEVISNDVAASTYWVTGSAVRAEDAGIAVKQGEGVGWARVGLLGGAVEDVVGLIGGVKNVTPEECGTNWGALVWIFTRCRCWRVRTSLASSRVVVNAVADECAATRSTENIANNLSTLRVAVDYDMCARAFGVVRGDLRDTVGGTLSNLGAVWCAPGDVEHNVHVVAGLALGSELGAGCIDEGGGTAIVVRGIVATSHEDGYIDTWCVEPGSSLRGGESSEGASGDGLTEDGHDYGIKVV